MQYSLYYSYFHYSTIPLDITDSVAEAYGTVKKELLAHGNVMPENDMWIAAAALVNEVSVITQDKHFNHIPGLSVITL